jgi:hypothetical protein
MTIDPLPSSEPWLDGPLTAEELKALGGRLSVIPDHDLPRMYDFKEGKLWPNDRPGLGVEVDASKLTKIGEYDTYRAGMLMNQHPDGSFMNW